MLLLPEQTAFRLEHLPLPLVLIVMEAAHVRQRLDTKTRLLPQEQIALPSGMGIA
jgi:hypothetical protein